MNVEEKAKQAKSASIDTASHSAELKNKALAMIADALEAKKADIIAANAEDLSRSETENLAMPLMKRLKFSEEKIKGVISGIKDLIALPDPANAIEFSRALDDGLNLYKVVCPIGVIGVIFESRPDALVQISTLCLKSGNAVLLKGGSEAKLTNKILYEIIDEATKAAGISPGWIQLIETREDVNGMLALDDYIDLIIPRGSNAFVKYIMQHSDIPVLGHADGICHCFVDDSADLDMAVQVAYDSKTQYVAACNAIETLLVHGSIAEEFLPKMKAAYDQVPVDLYGCDKTQAIIETKAADADTYKTEYLDYAISIKVVSSVEEAIKHINTYGSGHTDTIITQDDAHAKRFLTLVDAANVYVNASTRFADGFRYGFGAEVGISTNKTHARGPVGLDGLMIYKYKLVGSGQIVGDYASGKSQFKHKTIDILDQSVL